MAADEIRQEIGYQRENQTNIGWAGNRLTDSDKYIPESVTNPIEFS